ncbi:hypothetical protein GCM10027062_25660 [Nocardioides hungaricus]
MVLGLGVVAALLVTVRLSASGEGSTAADLGERVAAPRAPASTPPATGSGTPVRRSVLDAALPPAQRVLQAAVVKPKPPRVLERERIERIAARQANTPYQVTVGSFNVLGSQHTGPGGTMKRYPPASVRSAGAAGLIAAHDVDVVGTQELQADQLAAITARTGLTAWPGTAWGSEETDNSILYDDARFDYVSGDSITIPFMGRPRPQPILRLRDTATQREFYVVNAHLSAGGGRYLTERRQGQAALISLVGDLRATGLPVLVTGDMNDREEFYCRVVGPAGLLASNGGGAGCAPPPGPIPVDWVVGAGVTWSGYWRDTSAVTRRISNHFFISATASVE